MTVSLQEMADFDRLIAVYQQYFPQDTRAKTCVAVKEMPERLLAKRRGRCTEVPLLAG